MSGFKNLLKSDTPTSRSTALGGQGSHFQSQRDDDPPFATRAAESDTLGSTVTGTEPQTAGPSDTSAAPAPASHALNTAGPEAGGSGHIGTASTTDSAAAPSGSTAYSFPKTLRPGNDTSSAPSAGANTGSAAVGQTTTYSSRPLASGDPTGSVVDHQSTDPLTYKLPEAGSHPSAVPGTGNSATTGTSPTGPTSSSGVTSSAAATAASAAWATHNKPDTMPGEFPSDASENPYRATNLDPRVDGGKPPPSSTHASSSIPSRPRDSALGTSSSTGAGSLGTSYGERTAPTATHEPTGPAPSTLTTTADPAARAAQYAASSNTEVPDTTSAATTQSQTAPEQQGMMGRALGAMGLGGAASTAAGYLGYGARDSDTTDPRDSSAVATQPGVAARESGPPKHYRRESIPTTAYPSTDAARPIAPPVGGTLDARRSVDQGFSGSGTDRRISNDRGLGGTPATVEGVAGSGFGLGSGTSGVPRQEYSESSQVRDNIGTGSSHDSHTGRNIAAGGAAAAATGAGIHGLQHQGRDDNLRSSAAEDARRDPSSGIRDDTRPGGHTYTIGGHQTHQSAPVHGGSAPVDAISSRDPNYRDPTSSQGTGFGSSTSPSGPIDAVAAAPGRYDGQDYSSTSRNLGSGEHSLRRDDNSHTGRDAALGASAAAAAIYTSSSDRERHGTIHDAITVPTPTTTGTSGQGASTRHGTVDSREYETHSAHDTSSHGTSTGYDTAGSRGTTGLTSATGQSTTGQSSYGTSTGHGTTGLTAGGTSTSGPSSYGTSTGYDTTGTRGTTGTTGPSSYGTSAGHGTTGLTTGGTSASGPSSYGTSGGYGAAPVHDNTTVGDRNLRQDDDHTRRNVGLGAAAGTAAAGGAAYAAHDRHSERELEKQREADAKDAAKREKATEKELEKERSHAEKEERKYQKEAEKEEKKHQKEVEKEEKKQQKELDKEEREHAHAAEKREHARLAAEEEDRKRREREATAGVATAGTTGAIAHETQEREKKPSIFKRIFKRRKNKDTGEEEEYSSDDEEDKRRYNTGDKQYTAGGVPVHLSGDKGRNVLGHETRDKEAYKEHPAWKGPVTDVAAENSMNTPGRPHPGAEERLGYEPGSTSAGYGPSGREGGAAAITGASAAGTSSGFGTSSQPRENISSSPYDSSRDYNAAQGLSSHGTGSSDARTTGLTSGTDDRPRDSITGLPYDPSKDPTTAARLSEHEQGGLTGTGTGGVLGSEPLGEIGDHRR